MGTSVSNPLQDGRTLSGLIPVWRLRGLNLPAADSAFWCCSDILCTDIITRPSLWLSEKAMHRSRQTGMQWCDFNLYQQAHFVLREPVLATLPRTEGHYQDWTPVWRLRGLNLPVADSAFWCCSDILCTDIITRPSLWLSEKAMHRSRQTGMQWCDFNLYQQAHFVLREPVLATLPRTEGHYQDWTPVWRLRGLNLQADDSAPAAAQSHHVLIKSPAR